MPTRLPYPPFLCFDGADTGVALYSLLGQTPWRAHAKLVLLTPEGLGLPGFVGPLLAPLTNLSVLSLADFSARLVSRRGGVGGVCVCLLCWAAEGGGCCLCFAGLQRGPLLPTGPFILACGLAARRPMRLLLAGLPFCCMKAPGTASTPVCSTQQQQLLQAAAPESFEGPPQRCFRWLYYCNDQFGFQAESPPVAYPVRAYARSVLEHHGMPLPAGEPAAPGPAPLKVRFHRRRGGTRQLLNAEELVAACSAWSPWPLAGSPASATDCSQVGGGSLYSSLLFFTIPHCCVAQQYRLHILCEDGAPRWCRARGNRGGGQTE